MHVTLTSPAVGLTAVYPCATPTGPSDVRWRRYRQGVKSAPAHARDRNQYPGRKSRSQVIRYPQHRQARPAATRISIDDVVNMAEHTREMTSLHSRRLVMEEAHKALRNEGGLDRSRPHSVVGPGLQSITSPMPSPSRAGQVEHIPSLLPLPSDRTFIPSPDQYHDRHLTTPSEYIRLEDENSHSPVARQCCEIMGPSLCRSCRRLESRAQNRKSAELECPRMRSAGGRGRQTFSLTQVIKRSYPRLSDAEIQDKLARGEIARVSFPWASRSSQYDEDSFMVRNTNTPSSDRSSVSDKQEDEDEEEEDQDILHIDPGTYRATTPSTRPTSSSVNCDKENNVDNHGDLSDDKLIGTTGHRQQLMKASLSTKNAFYFLAKLSMKLRGSTTTPLFFSDLRNMQGKILSGAVERKAYMTLRPDSSSLRTNQQDPPSRLKSAVSTASTSSGKSGLSKLGSQLSKEFMPAFVSPRKVKLIEEPKYKVYFEPPLLTKRRQIPNPSFFAGSNDEYSLPERLPDVIEFADSQRIAAMEKQIRSGSALSFVSSMSDDQQQQQPAIGQQDMLTSLPLGSGNENGEKEVAGNGSRPGSSGRGSMGERGVSTPTPRSTMRVSSGGPLSSRTVQEENEEDLQREIDQGQQNSGENSNNGDEPVVNGDNVCEEPQAILKTETKLGTIDENSHETKADEKNQDANVKASDPIEIESKTDEIKTSGPEIVESQQVERELVSSESDAKSISCMQEEQLSVNEKMDNTSVRTSVEESNTNEDSLATFFLTNREQTNHDEVSENDCPEIQQSEVELSRQEVDGDLKTISETHESDVDSQRIVETDSDNGERFDENEGESFSDKEDDLCGEN